MRKSTVIILTLAVVLLCGGCASTGGNKKTESGAQSGEDYSPNMAASDEGIAGAVNEKAAQAGKAMKKAVNETVVAVKETVKDFEHKAEKFGKAAAGEMNNVDLSPLKNAAGAAAKVVKKNGDFPWWIIILIIILLLIALMTRSRGKKG
jgi:uncharacterized protein YceK